MIFTYYSIIIYYYSRLLNTNIGEYCRGLAEVRPAILMFGLAQLYIAAVDEVYLSCILSFILLFGEDM